jgi:Protein of unknown function (DUF416)
VTSLDAATKAGLSPSQIAVSRPICAGCQAAIQNSGGQILPGGKGCVVAEMSGAEPTFDERQIRNQLDALPAISSVAFAAACAEWLYPCYEEFARATGQGDPAALRAVVDAAWSLAESEELPRNDIEHLRTLAELLVPNDDDENWSTLSPLAQNAAASTAYAVRTWLLEDPQQAVWAARQLFEAGDYLVQLVAPFQSYVATTDSDEPASLAISGIALALAHSGSQPVANLRIEAASGAVRLRRLLGEVA